ncbi:MAG: 3-keto-disaccharide hydrolase [Thalassotalea sp.]
MHKILTKRGLKKISSLSTVTTALLLTGIFSAQAASSDWQSLFNGKDLSNWTVKIHHHDVGVNFADTFRAEDGMIKVRYDKYQDFNQQYGHLYYDQEFANFHLKLDYRFSGEFMQDAPHFAELNSGVMFYSQSPKTMPKEQNWPISVEMQFLAGLADGKKRPTGNMCSPGTDVIYQGSVYPSHCLISSAQTFDKNDWVQAELIVNNGEITQLINGQVVLQYSNPTMGKAGTVTGYEERIFEQGKLLTSGYIALQSEGQPIEFKNILIKAL